MYVVVAAAVVGWAVLEGEEGVSGVPLDREGHVLNTGCNCNSVGCGCAGGMYCSGNGLCYACSQFNCNERPAECLCSTNQVCSSSGHCVTSTCQCSAGWVCNTQGQCVQPTDACTACSHGTKIYNGATCTCSCHVGYTATSCTQCAAGYTGYPSCRLTSTCSSSSCNGRGTAYSISGSCACTCNQGYAGISCSQCAAGYSGHPYCTSQATTCSNTLCSQRGTAVWSTATNGCSCVCNAGYAGLSCGGCAAGYYGYPMCQLGVAGVGCNTAYCNHHGVGAYEAGACRCMCGEGYGGAQCETCLAGFYNYPYCIVGSHGGWSSATDAPPGSAPGGKLPGREGATGTNDSDDDLPPVALAVIILCCIAVCLGGGIAAFLTWRQQSAKAANPAQQPDTESEVQVEEHQYQANPIKAVFEQE